MMTAVQDFNVYVGTETGYLKGINFNKTAVITKNFKNSTSNADHNITTLSWNDADNEDEVLVGFANQKISIFNTDCNSFSWSRTFNFADGSLVSAFRSNGKIIAGINTGEVAIVHGRETVIIDSLHGVKTQRKTKKTALSKVKPNLSFSSQLATGGFENDLAIWDMNKPSYPMFRAKNVADDMLQLRVPIWISDLDFLPSSKLVATASRHKHIRLYDPVAQRRPVINFEWDNPVTCLSCVPSSDYQIVAGTDRGQMALFDLRKVAKKATLYCAYKSFSGGVTDICVHDSLPLIFSVSLDRCVRVHHLKAKNLIYKQYLTSRLSCVLPRKDIKEDDFITLRRPLFKRKNPVSDTHQEQLKSSKIKLGTNNSKEIKK